MGVSSKHATCIRCVSMDINEREDCMVTWLGWNTGSRWILIQYSNDGSWSSTQILDVCAMQACHVHPVHQRERKDCVIVSCNIGPRWNPTDCSHKSHHIGRYCSGTAIIGDYSGIVGHVAASPVHLWQLSALQPESFLTFCLPLEIRV